MTQSGLRTRLLSSEDQVDNKEISKEEFPATAKVFQGSGPALRNWKIATPEAVEKQRPTFEKFDFDDDVGLIKSAHQDKFRVTPPAWLQTVQYLSVFLTVGWLTFSAIYLSSVPNVAALLSSPATLGSIVASILAPISLLWLCVASWQRRSDAHLYAEALRRELQRLLFPTEEQSRAVNRDVQLLVQQAVEISASSRAALKAIQRARQGLRSEIRDFAGVSQKTEFHIDRLAETLAKRADELVTLTDQIEKRSKNITEEVKSGVDVWTEISEEALAQVNKIQSSFDETATTFEGKTKLLTDASSKLSQETSKLEVGFNDRFSKLETLGTQSLASFEKIATGLEKIDEVSEGFFSRSEEVEKNLSRQSETIRAAASDLNERVSELDLIGASAANKLGEALQMALAGSDSIVSAVRRAREQLEKAASDTVSKADELIEQTDQRIETLSASAAERLNNVQTVLASFDDRHKDIAAVLSQLNEQNENVTIATDTALDRLTSAVQLLDSSAQTLDMKSAKPVAEIREAADHLSSQIEQIHQNLLNGVGVIDVNTEKAKAAADEIAKSLKEKSSELAGLSAQVTGHAKTIQSGFDITRDQMSTFIETTETRIGNFETRLDRQIDKFTTSVGDLEGQLENLGSELSDKGRKSVEEAGTYIEELQILEANLVDQLSGLSSQAMQTQLTVQYYEASLRATVEATVPLYEKMTAGAEQVSVQFTQLRDNAKSSSDDIYERMEALSRELESQIAKLNAEVETSERSLLSLSGDIKTSVTNLGSSSDEANEKLKHLHTSLQGRTNDLQLLADQAELRIGNLQKVLGVNTDNIKESLDLAVDCIEHATGQLEKSSETIKDRAETSAEKINSVSNLFIEEGHRLAMTGEQTLHKTARLVSAIQAESVELSDKSKEALAQLQKTTDSLSIRVREIEAYTDTAIRNTESYNESLKGQIRNIADSSVQITDAISENLSALNAQAEEAAAQGEKITDKVERARQNLAKEADRLEVTSRKATDIAEESASRFARHSGAIMKSAEDISGHAERIRDLQIRSNRESFLSSAKFVIESLHSLSVDVSRHLESDVDERSWRAYQKGDVAVFTRRLVNVTDDMPMEKSRKKFAEDNEFRSYVQRYLRQFEELFDSAQNNDHGELLSSIFVSSDVGKLYRLLCEVSGRPSKLG